MIPKNNWLCFGMTVSRFLLWIKYKQDELNFIYSFSNETKITIYFFKIEKKAFTLTNLTYQTNLSHSCLLVCEWSKENETFLSETLTHLSDLLSHINLSLFILLRMKQRKLQFTFRNNTTLFRCSRQNHLCLFSFKWSKENYFLTKKRDFAYLLCRARRRTSPCVFFFEWRKENYGFLLKKTTCFAD